MTVAQAGSIERSAKKCSARRHPVFEFERVLIEFDRAASRHGINAVVAALVFLSPRS
jgi:hypothetical protein